MTVVTSEHGESLRPHEEAGGDGHGEGGHHETLEQRDRKERLAVWLFIAGDALILILELFTWFYLKALNTNGMWRGAACTTASPCTDGLGNPITHEIAKANPSYTIVVALLAVCVALAFWGTESSARKSQRSSITAFGGLGLLGLLAAVAVQCYQFGALPFSTIDGTYASTFEFFMGSTLAHLILLTFIGIGLLNRARLGRYDGGRWYQLRLIRVFAVWIAASVCILALVMSLFT